MPEISWRHDRRRLLLPVSVLPSVTSSNPEQSHLITGLLDTGATATGIRKDVAERLRLEKRGRRRVFTANGDIIADEHLVRVGLFPGAFEFHPFDLSGAFPYVLERELLVYCLHPNFSFEMIIGMDVIGHADLSINRLGEAVLHLP